MKSLSLKWTLTVVALLTVMICSIFAANLYFLDDYYIYKTRSIFIAEYNYLSMVSNKKIDELNLIINRRSQDNSLKYLIVDKTFRIISSTYSDIKGNSKDRLPREKKEMIAKIDGGYYYGAEYRDDSDKSDVVLVGKLASGNYIFIMKPMELLIENAEIANYFLLIIGVTILLLSIILTYILSRKAVKPILEITSITKSIEELDFSKKYTGNLNDEVGLLGESINSISYKLDKTIGELKSEMELQKRFLASISHEFKTPVSLIRGYSESLSMTNSKEELKEFEEIIISEADRLNDLLDDLLLLIRIESTSFSMSFHDFNISDSIYGVIDKYRLGNKLSDFDLNIAVEPEINFYGDEKRIIQVVVNILNNGINHTAPGGAIHLMLKKLDRQIVFEIYNDGELIPQEHLEHLVKPFYSADYSRTGKGSGLGLAIVNSIVLKHGGMFRIENSTNGVVATVTLNLDNEEIR